jgi:hypothetical protein
MKLLGFLMVTAGFILAALATVVDQSALREIDESTVEVVEEGSAETVNESTVKWMWYIPALGLGAAGVIIIRVDHARQNKTEHHIAARIETVESSLEKISTNINKLNSEKHSIHTYDMRHRIDELFIDDIDKFVDARESIAHRYGLAAYGEVMSTFAAGERYLNRVWSASADGYIDEVNAYLEKAREQFVESLAKIHQLKTNPDLQTSTFS